jgi:hypothetical protein
MRMLNDGVCPQLQTLREKLLSREFVRYECQGALQDLKRSREKRRKKKEKEETRYDVFLLVRIPLRT